MARAADIVRLGAALALVAGACGPRMDRSGKRSPGSEETGEGGDRPDECPALASASEPLPRVSPEQKTRGYWLERLAANHEPDEELLSAADVGRLNAALALSRPKYSPQRDLSGATDLERLQREVDSRVRYFAEKTSSGEYRREDGEAPEEDAAEAIEFDGSSAELRVALETVQIHCFPYPAALYTDPDDPRFDRNACSSAHPQEVVRVVAGWPNGMRLAETRFAVGWIDEKAALSPPVPAKLRPAFTGGPQVIVESGPVRAEEGALLALDRPTLLPAAGGERVHFASASGFHRSTPLEGRVRQTTRPITRRAVLEEALSFLGRPYGFGGKDGGLDCSRFLLDLFARFGLNLPRHSSWQAKAGTFSVDVSEADEKARRQIIDAAGERGLVFLHFPGHIMLYLGRSDEGAQLAIHALGEYPERCGLKEDPELETLHRVERVTISDLELGRGSSRGAFIQRLTRVTVLGRPPGPELAGVAELRPAAPAVIPPWKECRGGDGADLFVSPERPNAKQPLRVIATSKSHPGSAELVLVGPDGEQHRPEVIEAGGPPFGHIAAIEAPAPGRWRAVLADGDDLRACRRVLVRKRPSRGRTVAGDGPVWEAKRRWGPGTENFYAVFIERLFDYPLDDDEQTWPSLQPILRDPERNILFGHLRPGDDDGLELKADCADLPYTLRAYFAWKMRLPFAFRQCRRARNGRPPTCRAPGGDNLMSLPDFSSNDEVKVFEHFANRHVRRIVHSSSARTTPKDDETDYYPVALDRRSLKPGTLFADPYGHLLVVVDWIPQTLDDYGVLVAADAQPDGTVGRRRFWRGSFLFHPETDTGGAGFKAFRPRILKKSGGEPSLQRLSNRELSDSEKFTRFALDQYEGSEEDFYRALEALINPRPLDPFARQRALIDAFEEQVARRVVSVANSEEFMAERNFRPIDMPHGSSIFLTSGPWEDYSTPSRDLRLLIALDTVAEFPDRVEASPERFAIEPDEVKEEVSRLRAALREELEKRSITYVRSDGSKASLDLAKIVDRKKLLEMAYNPNDCVEVRWLAPKGSDEMKTCKRHAPAEQKRRMAKYRHWFSTRRRPAN